uniref:Era-type G domain-containing protein n=1 Tax=Picea sitchensis TaxID=3332 RepID=D5AC54_PICSI|nr:unknown [Picea sitchensis]
MSEQSETLLHSFMELTAHLHVHAPRTFSKDYFCILPLLQRASLHPLTKCKRKISVTRRRNFMQSDKDFSVPLTNKSKTEIRDKTRVSPHAQSSEDRVSVSLNDKPERMLNVKEEGADNGGDYDYGDLSVGPDHRSGYVAVVGKPNVGKSTLLNQMIGQKLSIVTDKPQTTRHRILGLCSAPDYQMVLYDTPGVIQKEMHKLDAMMMKNVHSATGNADCVLTVVDVCKVPEKVNDLFEEDGVDLKKKPPTLLVLNKKDLMKPGEIAKRMEWYEKFGGADHILSISAKYGHGVEDVKNWIVSKLPYGPAYYSKDIISEHPERFFVAEIVREKIFMQYRQEVPYACQVNVASYIARPTSKHFIEIEIVVEKGAQKIILIGKEGKALKLLATAARLDIEDFLQKQVYLEIKVKVKPNWRQDVDLLKRFGYSGAIRPY